MPATPKTTIAGRSKGAPRLDISITQEHIDAATPKDSSHCMIADAVQAALPTARYISVDLATIRFSDPAAGIRYIYLTPRGAQEALLAFDSGEKPEPFNMRLQRAHVMPTGQGARGRAESIDTRTSDTSGTPPERRGGEAPPLGPLAGGSPQRRTGQNPGAGASNRTGRRREFGLRAIIR